MYDVGYVIWWLDGINLVSLLLSDSLRTEVTMGWFLSRGDVAPKKRRD